MCAREVPVAVEVRALMVDPSSNLPIVILHDPAGDRYLPIWIGLFEAQAIAMELEDVDRARPMTHDLFFDALSQLEASVERVVISDLKESTFHAQILLRREGRSDLTLDARPSDAIALALRAGAEVYVVPSVLAKALTGDLFDKLGSEDDLRKWLEDADPEVFGKYEM